MVTSRFPESLQRPFRRNSLLDYTEALGTAPVNAGSWFNLRPANRVVLNDNSQVMTFTSSNLSSASSSFVPTQFQG